MLKTNINFIPDKLYKQIVKRVPICTVDVVFLNSKKTKVLLFKRTNPPFKGRYYTAGGRLLKNEDLKKAAVRLMKHELGLKLNPRKLFWGGVVNEVMSTSIYAGINYHTVNNFWGYIIDHNNFKFDRQHTEAAWLSVADKRIPNFVRTRIKVLLKNHD